MFGRLYCLFRVHGMIAQGLRIFDSGFGHFGVEMKVWAFDGSFGSHYGGQKKLHFLRLKG